MDNENTKPVWQSKTVIASVIGFIAVVLGFFGYDFTGADQATLSEVITATIAGVSSVVAIYGRIKASKKISK